MLRWLDVLPVKWAFKDLMLFVFLFVLYLYSFSLFLLNDIFSDIILYKSEGTTLSKIGALMSMEFNARLSFSILLTGNGGTIE